MRPRPRVPVEHRGISFTALGRGPAQPTRIAAVHPPGAASAACPGDRPAEEVALTERASVLDQERSLLRGLDGLRKRSHTQSVCKFDDRDHHRGGVVVDGRVADKRLIEFQDLGWEVAKTTTR